jgi:hypothetical protein
MELFDLPVEIFEEILLFMVLAAAIPSPREFPPSGRGVFSLAVRGNDVKSVMKLKLVCSESRSYVEISVILLLVTFRRASHV